MPTNVSVPGGYYDASGTFYSGSPTDTNAGYSANGIMYTPTGATSPLNYVTGSAQNPTGPSVSDLATKSTTNSQPKPAPSNNSNEFNLSNFPGYTGWDPQAAYQDWLKTGGEGKRATGGSDYDPLAAYYNEQSRLIDETTNQNMDYLGQQEKALQESLPGEETAIKNKYDLNARKVGDVREGALTQFNLRENALQSQKQDALSAARRLYNELQMGYKQRFGGSTSAGEAAQSILGTELQRQQGSIQRQVIDQTQEILNQKSDMERTYQTNLVALEKEKEDAMNTLQSNFKQKLLDIMSEKNKAYMWQSERKLEALKELATATRQVALKAQEFQQQMALQRQKMDDSYNYELSLIKEKAAIASTKNKPISYKVLSTDKGTYFYNSNDPLNSIQDATGIVGSNKGSGTDTNWEDYLSGTNLD